MGEVIAIPLSSERRAAVVLAALRRLEAEYRVESPAPSGGRKRIAAWVCFWLGRARKGLRELRQGAGAAVVGGIIGLAIAAAGARYVVGAPWLGDRLGVSLSVPLVLLPGLALGVALGLAFHFSAARRARRGAPDGPPEGPENGARDVSWLISYVTLEPDGEGQGRVQASVLRITLPEAAEGRLKSILERAGAAAAR